MRKRKTQLYPIVIEYLAEGGYYAECPVLPGCHVEANTYAEAVENLEDAIRIFLDSYRELRGGVEALGCADQSGDTLRVVRIHHN